jgi:hypothetical protein
VKLEHNNAKIQEEKDQLLVEKIAVKEVVTRALLSVLSLAHEELESNEMQVGKLHEAIQQVHARVTESKLRQSQALCKKCAIRGKKLPEAQ